MLYTIIPPEIIFEESEESETPKKGGASEVEVKKGGVSFMVEPMPGGQAKLVRLISTDAQDYLNPEWQPGSIMSVF